MFQHICRLKVELRLFNVNFISLKIQNLLKPNSKSTDLHALLVSELSRKPTPGDHESLLKNNYPITRSLDPFSFYLTVKTRMKSILSKTFLYILN